MYTQADAFLKLQDEIRQQNISPISKLRVYVDTIAELQIHKPYHIHLIYRELLSAQPMFENYVKNRLYKVHLFMTELVDEAIATGEISTNIKPTHVAFTLEGMIMFFFLTKSQIKVIGNFEDGKETDYLITAMNSYLESLSK